jgi:hypothetical protein
MRTETDLVSETLCFLVSTRIPDDGQSPKPSNSEHKKTYIYIYTHTHIHIQSKVVPVLNQLSTMP